MLLLLLPQQQQLRLVPLRVVGPLVPQVPPRPHRPTASMFPPRCPPLLRPRRCQGWCPRRSHIQGLLVSLQGLVWVLLELSSRLLPRQLPPPTVLRERPPSRACSAQDLPGPMSQRLALWCQWQLGVS